MAEINVVPLIDVLLVLLIIFMVIAPISPSGLRAAIPQPAGPASAGSESVVVVQVMADGSLKMNQRSVSWESFASHLDSIFEKRAQKVAFVQGENLTQFSDVARALDVMHAQGIDTVGLLSSASGQPKANQ